MKSEGNLVHVLDEKHPAPGANLISVSPDLGAAVTVNAAVGLFSAAGMPIWLQQQQQAAPGSDNPLRGPALDRRPALPTDVLML